jgi:hypothetical protein
VADRPHCLPCDHFARSARDRVLLTLKVELEEIHISHNPRIMRDKKGRRAGSFHSGAKKPGTRIIRGVVRDGGEIGYITVSAIAD